MDWLTLLEAADYLRVSKETMYRLVTRKEVKAYQPTRKWLFKKEDLDKFVNDKSVQVSTKKKTKKK